MKKVIALALTLALATSLVACGTSTPPADNSNSSSQTSGDSSSSQAATDGSFKTGVGSVISAKPTDAKAAEGDKPAAGSSVQVNTTLVAATFDKDGKIVSCTIDVAQQTAKFDVAGKVSGEIDLRTKNEKGPDYGMAKVSEIKKEVNEQHEALAQWMVGKTVAEVKAMKTFKRDDAHTAVPEVEDLKASVTITVQDYIAALEEAEKNAVATTAPVAKTGLGIVTSASPTDAKAAEGDKPAAGPSAQINTTFVGVALDADGKVVGCSIDVAQQTAKFDVEGKLVGEIDLRTKNEKGPDYGMAKVSEIKKEVNEQHEALAQWMIGKTPAEVTGMKTFKRDDAHTAVPEVEDLKASVTITVQDYLAAFDKAVQAAR